jgi:Protein of unknown function (DUF4245)
VTTTDSAPPKRARQSVADMLRSLAVVGVVIAVTLIFVPGLLHPSKSQRYVGVTDDSDYLSGFHRLSGRAALAPVVPKTWTINAASLDGNRADAHVHIGYVTPGSRYAGLDESVRHGGGFVASILGPQGAAVTGSMRIGDRTWQIRTSARGEYSLTDVIDGLSVVITGNASDAQLQELAGSLR